MTSRSSGDETRQFLKAAVAYARMGWRVFPLRPRDKRPITETGVLEATANESEVLRWWQMFPDANIGIDTGGPFNALDIDGAGGVPYLAKILGQDYKHNGPVVITGRGDGRHLYFAAVEGARNRAGLLGQKIDFRASGGYVVGPPSVHPETGLRWRWDEKRGPKLTLPPMPDALRELVLKHDKPVQPRIAMRKPDGSIIMDSAAEQARSRPDILQVAANLGLVLKRNGAYWVTNCVFHTDPGPSLVLYQNQNKFFCYGCEAHGDSKDLANLRDMTGRIGVV